MTLSKSLYTRAIQCPKALWLKKYKPSVLTPPDASIQAVFETGNILQARYFGDGEGVGEIEVSVAQYLTNLEKVAKIIIN